MDEYALAELAYHVERDELGIASGCQKQYTVVFGGFNYIGFHGGNKVVLNPL